ncbi:hypothetical protein D3C71_1448460 [compost metagenome]
MQTKTSVIIARNSAKNIVRPIQHINCARPINIVSKIIDFRATDRLASMRNQYQPHKKLESRNRRRPPSERQIQCLDRLGKFRFE